MMFRYFKKHICSFICVLTALMFLVSVDAAYAQDNIYEERFDSTSIPFAAVDGVEMTTENGSLRITNSGNVDRKYSRYKTVIPVEPEERYICAAFDIKLQKKDFYGQMVFYDGTDDGVDTERLVMTITSTGYLSFSSGYISNSTSASNPSTEYKVDEWMMITLIIDRETNSIAVYVGEDNIGMVVYQGDWDDLLYFRLDPEKSSTETTVMYLDNFIVACDNVRLDQGAVSVKFGTDNIGNIFFDKNFSFELEFTDRQNGGDYWITAYLTDELENVSCETEYSLSLGANASRSVSYQGTAPRYGFYTINTRIVNKNTGEVIHKTKPMSVSKRASVSNVKSAVCDHMGTQNQGLAHAYDKYGLIVSAGFSGVRDVMEWNLYEAVGNAFVVPDSFALAYDAAYKNGLYFLNIAGMHNSALRTGRPPRTNEDLKLWRRYVQNMVKDTKYLTGGYEIWNEYNDPAKANNGEGTPEDYINLARVTYETIKEEYPDAMVYGLGGIAFSGNKSDEEYLELIDELLSLGLADFCDGFSIHPYTLSASPKTEISIDIVKEVRKLMEKHGCGDMPLIASEMGWSSADIYNVTEEQQAEWTVKYSVMSYDLLDRIYWYNFQEKIQTTEKEIGFGFIRNDNAGIAEVPYAAKPVYLAMANYNNIIAGATLMKRCDTDSEKYLYKFKNRNGSNTFVLWNDEGTEDGNVSIPVTTEFASVVDMYGNAETVQSIGGSVIVKSGKTPQYIIELPSKKMEVYAEIGNDLMTLSGYAGVADEVMTILVRDNNGSLTYIDQSKADDYGYYSLTLPTTERRDSYYISVKAVTSDQKETDTFFAPGIRIVSNKEPVTRLADLQNGDEFSIEMAIDEEFGTRSAIQVIEAQYRDNIPMHVAMIDNSVSENGRLLLNMTDILGDEIDSIKIFFWDPGKLLPFTECYVLK